MSVRNGDTSPLSSPRFLRPSLRNATVILPRSGERVKRSVTLRDPRLASDGDGSADHDDDSRTPLLFRRRRTSKHIVPRASWATAGAALAKSWGWATSPLGQSVLKCSIAYLLGSMATFIPALSNFLGHHDGKHMVATVTVYFHSARSQGSMHEATLLAIAATMYASFVAFTSMGLSILFARLGLMVLGHAIVLVVFCGIGLGFVGWLKLRLSNPLVNVACSLTSLTIITVLTKEGSVQLARFSAEKPVQVVKMVLMGIFATTGVCLLLNPISARNELKKSMIDVTDTLGEMMAFVTRNFLYGFDGKNRPSSFKAIESRHNTAMAALTKHLREAKYEHYVWGTERQYHLEVRIVDCMQRLAQNIGGLRSAAATQSAVLDKAAQGDLTPQTASQVFTNQTTMSPSTLFSELGSPQEQQPWNLSSIDELPEENGDATDTGIGTSKPVSEAASLMTISNPGDIFARFIDQLGPSMKSLAYTLKLILDELPFSPHPEFRVTINPHFQHSLDDAQELYAKSRKQALRLLYRSKELNKSRPVAVAADFEEVAASCGHFSFSLQDFADEMRIYLDVLEEYKVEVERRPRERSWSWLKFWQRKKPDVLAPGEDPERMALLERTVDLEMPTNFNSSPQTKPSDKAKDTKARFRQRLYHTLRFFRRDDVKFAIKVGVGAMLYALPAFLPSTRPFYSRWRGEWGLLSYMLVCSMTIGASNTTGYQRFLGTCVGAICAIVAWIVSRANPFALAFMGWAMSVGCFYIIVAQGRGPMGRFILLTYNLSALYAYSLSVKDDENDDDEGGTDPHIFPITLHRVVAVMSGCIWGMIITRLIWPISARSKLKNGLSRLWLRMGLIWKRDPLSSLLEGSQPTAYMNLREELQLQSYIAQLRTLRASAVSEFELRGPFPEKSFSTIMEMTSDMLDAFHAMNAVIIKDLKATPGETRILEYTAQQRRQLSSRISHLFQVLASSMKLEYPINNALPSIDHTRDRLLARTFEFRKAEEGNENITDEDFGLLYAYALVTAQLAADIEAIGDEIESLFGVFDEDLLKSQ